MYSSEPNTLYDFKAVLQMQKTYTDFKKVIRDFIRCKMPFNKAINVNSLFDIEKEYKWRKRFIQALNEIILENPKKMCYHVFTKDFSCVFHNFVFEKVQTKGMMVKAVLEGYYEMLQNNLVD